MENSTEHINLGLSSGSVDDDPAVRGSFTLRNFGRSSNTSEGSIHYLDRVEAEYAAKNPINRFLNFINRHNPWRR